MTPARVYLVVWWFDRMGGMERHVTDMAVALARRGIEVTVFSEMPLPRSNAYARELIAAGVPIAAPRRRLSPRLEASKPFRLLAGLDRAPSVGWTGIEDEYLRHQHATASARGLLRRLQRHARRAPPDIVHVHGCRMGQHGVLQWAAGRGYPSVYTEHVTISDWGGTFDPQSPWVVSGDADAIACVSDYSRSSLLACLPAHRDVQLTRHIIRDPRLADPETGPQPRDWNASPANLLAVGRLSIHKGYDVLLQAAAQLRDEGARFHIRIAGGGEDREVLEQLRDRLDLADRVTFLGQVSQAEVAELWKQADLGVTPSRTEALPLSIVEAMARGRPVIASRVGGVPEIVQDGQNGILVEPGDIPGLARAIRRLIDDPILAAKLGAEARRRFETGGWSEDAVVAQTLATYAKAKIARAEKAFAEGGRDASWANVQARLAATPIRRVSLFAWRLSSFGDMEHLITEQAVALARAGVEVTLYVEQPIRPFNVYVRALRRAGVRVTTPSPPRVWAGLLHARLTGVPLASRHARAFARAGLRGRPDALHVHGWALRLEGFAVILRQAITWGASTAYTEHAGSNARAREAVAGYDSVSAASPQVADALARATGRTVAVLRHAGKPRPALPSQGVADEAVTLSAATPGFGAELVEAMSAYRPVVVCGEDSGPIRDRANGLVVTGDPGAALRELASDPVLARQLAVSARRTYERDGLRDVAIVAETTALYRRAEA